MAAKPRQSLAKASPKPRQLVGKAAATTAAATTTATATHAPPPGGPNPSGSSRYFSSDVGLVHLVALDFNLYYGADSCGEPCKAAQLAWFENDLQLATANRAAVPWIIVTSHFPIFCTGCGGNVYVRPSTVLTMRTRPAPSPPRLQCNARRVLTCHRFAIGL